MGVAAVVVVVVVEVVVVALGPHASANATDTASSTENLLTASPQFLSGGSRFDSTSAAIRSLVVVADRDLVVHGARLGVLARDEREAADDRCARGARVD